MTSALLDTSIESHPAQRVDTPVKNLLCKLDRIFLFKGFGEILQTRCKRYFSKKLYRHPSSLKIL